MLKGLIVYYIFISMVIIIYYIRKDKILSFLPSQERKKMSLKFSIIFIILTTIALLIFIKLGLFKTFYEGL